jgi:hypothetical protein
MEEVYRLQAAPYWPGFEPRTIAAAVFDGADTLWPNRVALVREGIVAALRDIRISERSGRIRIRLKKSEKAG